MWIPHTKPTLAMSIGILLVATAWSSVAIASQATPATKSTSQPRSSTKAHLQVLSLAERTCHKAYSSIQAQTFIRLLETGPRRRAKALMIASCGKLARSGDAIDQGILGDFYSTLGLWTIPGGSRQAAYNKALYWYRKAAAQGYANAQYNLGGMYFNGFGVPQDYAKAAYWYRKAAVQGFAEAQTSLGWMYYDYGFGVPQDYAKAAYWYRKAAVQGVAVAQSSLGWMYDKGHGVPQDYTKAVYWFRKAATQGNARAQFILGGMYDKGHGVPQDYAKTVYWYRKAATQRDARAQFILGGMYDKGHGVPQDYAKTVYWFRKAATQGDAEAQSNLGLMYALGQGVPQDYIQASKWYILAKAGGNKYMSKVLPSLEQQMTPAQIAEAQRLATQWWKAHHKQ